MKKLMVIGIVAALVMTTVCVAAPKAKGTAKDTAVKKARLHDANDSNSMAKRTAPANREEMAKQMLEKRLAPLKEIRNSRRGKSH